MSDEEKRREAERLMQTSSVFGKPWREYLAGWAKVPRDSSLTTFEEMDPGFPVFVAGATLEEKDDEKLRMSALASMVKAVFHEDQGIVEAEGDQEQPALQSELALVLLYQHGYLTETETQAVLYMAGRPVSEDPTTRELELREAPHIFSHWYGNPREHPAVKLAQQIEMNWT